MQLVVEKGFDGTSVDAVCTRARVGRTEFDRRFNDLRDCCMQIYLANMDDFNAVVFGAASGEAPWQDRLRGAAYSAARYIQARPIQTRFDMIQMLEVGELAQAYRDRILGRIVDLIDEGRQELDDPESMSREVAVGIFGSIYQSLLKEVRGPNRAGAGRELCPAADVHRRSSLSGPRRRLRGAAPAGPTRLSDPPPDRSAHRWMRRGRSTLPVPILSAVAKRP